MRAPSWLTARPVAHRGLHNARKGVLENTLAAIGAAADRDFAVEIDVRLTGDDEVVAFHDATLDRLTDASGVVRQTPLSDMRKARLGVGGGVIPTLSEVLDRLDGRTPLFIEMKTNPGDRGLLQRLVGETLSSYDGQVAVMSFDPSEIISLRHASPSIVRGLVASRFEAWDWPRLSFSQRLMRRHLAPAIAAMPHFIAYDIDALPASAPLALRHFFRLPLLTWTVRTPEERERAATYTDQMIFEDFVPD